MPMCDVLQELQRSIVSFASAFDADALGCEEAGRVVQMCSRIVACASSMRDLAAARAAKGTAWQSSGHRSPAEDLATSAGTSVATARRRIEHGNRLARHPEVAGAALSGGLSPEQAELVAEGAEASPGKVAALIETAKNASMPELRDAVSRAKADATDAEARRRRIHARRSFRRFTDLDGAFHGVLYGAVDDGALLFALLEPIRRRLAALHAADRLSFETLDYDALGTLAAVAAGRKADLDLSELLDLGLFPQLGDVLSGRADRSSHGSALTPASPSAAPGTSTPAADTPPSGTGSTSPPGPAPDTRPSGTGSASPPGPAQAATTASRPTAASGPPGHVAVDGDVALSGLAPEAACGTAGTDTAGRRRLLKLAGSPTQILIRVDLDTLLRGVPIDGELCEIAGYGPVPVSVIEDLARSGNAFVVGVLTKAEQVLGVYRLRRRPSTAQRSALHFVYPTCAVAGCSARVGLQADHREDWARTRFTVFDLLDHLCPYHHRLKTNDGWALVAGRGKRAFVPPGDSRHPGRPSNARRAGFGSADSPAPARRRGVPSRPDAEGRGGTRAAEGDATLPQPP